MTTAKKSKINVINKIPTFSFINAIKQGYHCFFATTPTGLELFVSEELGEKLNISKEFIEQRRGKVLFATTLQNVPKVMKLKSVDYVYAMLYLTPTSAFSFSLNSNNEQRTETHHMNMSDQINNDFNSKSEKHTNTELSKDSVSENSLLINAVKNEFCWKEAIEAWIENLPLEERQHLQAKLKTGEISFRVTCKRRGEQTKILFGSSDDIARVVGAAIVQHFKWTVSLTNFDIEVYIHLQDEEITAGISLVKQLLSRRYHPDTGHGLLKPSIAYCMCRIANIQAGDVVMDPMCGVGTVILEAATSWIHPTIRYIVSDIDPKKCDSTKKNIEKSNLSNVVSVICCSVEALALCDCSIDRIISDVPFGKRHKITPNLYGNMLTEMYRVLRPKGCCVLLTTRSKMLYTSIRQQQNSWTLLARYFVNIGGLDGWIFHLEVNKTNRQ